MTTTVTNGESVNVDVVVVNTAEGIAVTGDATAHTLQYKITATDPLQILLCSW